MRCQAKSHRISFKETQNWNLSLRVVLTLGRKLELSYSWTHQSLVEDFPRGMHIPRLWAFYVCEPSSMRTMLQTNQRYLLLEGEVRQRGGRRHTHNCLEGPKGIGVKPSVLVFFSSTVPDLSEKKSIITVKINSFSTQQKDVLQI